MIVDNKTGVVEYEADSMMTDEAYALLEDAAPTGSIEHDSSIIKDHPVLKNAEWKSITIVDLDECEGS